MTIQLKPEQEQVIGLAIEAGLIRNVDDVLDFGVESIRRRLAEQSAPLNRWMRRNGPENHPVAFGRGDWPRIHLRHARPVNGGSHRYEYLSASSAA
jgi:hypothetical protein